MVEPRAVFEISWEVCNKVGGIYTVVSSKAAQMIKKYGDNYFLVGPFFPKKSWGVYEEHVAPEWLVPIFERLKSEGISCFFGSWLVKGSPKVILIDFANYTGNANHIKEELWNNFKIDSLGTTYFDFDEPCIWSWAVGRLIEEVAKTFPDEKFVAHAHEWLSASAIMYLKKNKIKNVGTIFTTHATMLGRTLASENMNIYNHLGEFNPEDEARKRGQGLWAKFLLERAAAKSCEVFTTVSGITGIEAEALLGRKPDVLLLNGLDLEKFPTFEEASIKHKIYRNRMREFAMHYFFPYEIFDIEHTLFYFLAGRYEFKDKGIDVFIEALAKLNVKLIQEKSKYTVIAFFFVPGNVRILRPEVLETKTIYDDVKAVLNDNEDVLKTNILKNAITQTPITDANLMDEDMIGELKARVKRFKRKGIAPITTHELYNEGDDIIVKTMRSLGLDNGPEDRVKVIFYPIYLSGADNLLNMTYYESMQGCHLGVFPSFYEPWGYTPLESGALGTSSVTTDLSGFGKFIMESTEQESETPGIYVLKRFNKTDQEAIVDLFDFLYRYTVGGKHARVENKMAARKLAEQADWKIFVKFYFEAHQKALSKL